MPIVDGSRVVGIVTRSVVTIGDRLDDETDRHVASVLAEAVPGVVRASAVAVREDEDR